MSHPFNAELQPGWVRREARHTDILTCRVWDELEAAGSACLARPFVIACAPGDGSEPLPERAPGGLRCRRAWLSGAVGPGGWIGA